MKKCINCKRYDFNDYIHGFGTCEPQDIDFKADHDCNVPNVYKSKKDNSEQEFRKKVEEEILKVFRIPGIYLNL